MPVFCFLRRSSSLCHKGDTVTSCLKRFSYRMRGVEKLLGDGSAPGRTLDPWVFSSNRFAVSRARFIHADQTCTHDERTAYVWRCSDTGEARVPLLVMLTRSVCMGPCSPCRSPTRLCSPFLDTPPQRVPWSTATYRVTSDLLLRTPKFVAPSPSDSRRRMLALRSWPQRRRSRAMLLDRSDVRRARTAPSCFQCTYRRLGGDRPSRHTVSQPRVSPCLRPRPVARR